MNELLNDKRSSKDSSEDNTDEKLTYESLQVFLGKTNMCAINKNWFSLILLIIL